MLLPLRRSKHLLVLLLALTVLPACDSGDTSTRVIEGVDFDLLFAVPTPAELQTIRTDWAGRDVSAQNVSRVASDTLATTGLGGTVRFEARVYKHDVAGVTHYGAVLIPEGLRTPAPVVVYAHGGDTGVKAADAATLAAALTRSGSAYIWVVPSFRDEVLTFGSQTFRSGGPASPWDYDVDDALALLNVALQEIPLADASRVGAVGLSRGGDVALLMAIRDARIQRVLDFFGPTDFLGPYVQQVVEDALRGTDRSLPGFDVLNGRFLQPLKGGSITREAVRLELLRRSPVYFTDRLPAVQVQHGTADAVVDVSQSRRLAAVMNGRADFRYFEWEGGGHTPLSFPLAWVAEAQGFLAAL